MSSRSYSLQLAIHDDTHHISVEKSALTTFQTLREIVCEDHADARENKFAVSWIERVRVRQGKEMRILNDRQLKNAIRGQTKNASGIISFKVKIIKERPFPLSEDEVLPIVRRWCGKSIIRDAPPLYLACEAGDLEAVQALLQCTQDQVQNESEQVKNYMSSSPKERVNKISPKEVNVTALHLAVDCGNIELASLLISHGANLEAKANDHSTPLHLGVSCGYTELVSLLISHGANLEARKQDGCTPLHLASPSDNSDIVCLLLESGADMETWDNSQSTPLHMSALRGWSVENTSILLAHKANVNARNKKIFANQHTPLHCAVGRGRAEIASLLIQNGADIHATVDKTEAIIPQNVQKRIHCTPLSNALFSCKPHIVSLLITHQADVETVGNKGFTPLFFAVTNDLAEMVSDLLEKKANVLARDNNQRTPLHYASSKGIAFLLISHKASIEAEDENQRTPLHSAARNDRINAASILIQHKANIEAKDKNQCTPLHLASSRRFEEFHLDFYFKRIYVEDEDQKRQTQVIDLLVEHKANTEAKDKSGKTPLEYASGYAHEMFDLIPNAKRSRH